MRIEGGVGEERKGEDEGGGARNVNKKGATTIERGRQEGRSDGRKMVMSMRRGQEPERPPKARTTPARQPQKAAKSMGWPMGSRHTGLTLGLAPVQTSGNDYSWLLTSATSSSSSLV